MQLVAGKTVLRQGGVAETVAVVGALYQRWRADYAPIRGKPLCRFGDLDPGSHHNG